MKKNLSVGLAALAALTIIFTGCYEHFAVEDRIPVPPPINYTAPSRSYTIPAGGGSIKESEEQEVQVSAGNLVVLDFFKVPDDEKDEWDKYGGKAYYFQIHAGKTYEITFEGTADKDIQFLTIALKASTETFDAVDWENKQALTAGVKATLTYTVTSKTTSQTGSDYSYHPALVFRAEKSTGPDSAGPLDYDVTVTGVISVKEK
jgi:hypothetical protein